MTLANVIVSPLGSRTQGVSVEVARYVDPNTAIHTGPHADRRRAPIGHDRSHLPGAGTSGIPIRRTGGPRSRPVTESTRNRVARLLPALPGVND